MEQYVKLVVRNTILTLLLIISSMMPGHGQSLPYACAGTMESYGVQGFPNSVFFWEADGGIIVDTIYGTSNDTVVVRWDYERRNQVLRVTEQTEFGCFGIPVEANIEVNAPVADIGDNEAVCEDDLFTFDATNSYLTTVTYLWPDSSTGNTFSIRHRRLCMGKDHRNRSLFGLRFGLSYSKSITGG